MSTTSLCPALPEVQDELTRREFVAALTAAGLLAACGRDRVTAPDGAATRTVTSHNGPVEVPADPGRVVAAIGSFEIDMVAVGVMPVLTTSFAGPWVKLGSSVKITENIPPDPEELLALRPDLMLGWNWVTAEPVYEKLVKIAPYVGLGESAATAGPGFENGPLKSWGTLFLSVCDVLGRRPEGERLVAELETRLDRLAERRSGQPRLRVARIEFYKSGSFSWRGQDEDTAELMRRIGLEVVGPATSERDQSLERLAEIDADRLIIPVGSESIPRAVYEEVAATPLFRAIPAVAAGRVDLVDARLWPGLGHLWARALVDDLERLYVPA
ncbi:MAG: ABC transporter substrate-binding protein [Actinomycetota bacterium]